VQARLAMALAKRPIVVVSTTAPMITDVPHKIYFWKRAMPRLQVGSVNADLVLPIDRLPRPGETIGAASMETIPGGKASQHLFPITCTVSSSPRIMH
jgi:hypothetical protein